MKAELLAPAGDFKSLKAAVSSGADAVYIGAAKFSARQNAKNFDSDELTEAIRYCRVRNVKTYLAINTLIKDSELTEALKTAAEAYEAGIDAYIVQDLGLIKLLRKKFDVPVHASTQMTIFDEYGLKFLKKLGIERAVLSRECPKEKIKSLVEKSIMELEVFCHGAIFLSYSGQCLLSSIIGGRSANRGRCAQPCRLPYSVDGKKGYFLSPKDLCLIDETAFLNEIGISSLKIEGRMKGPGYVAAATLAYRKAIDGEKVTDEELERLRKAFSRGGSFTKGCYGSVRGKDMMNISSSNDDVLKSADATFLKELSHLWEDGKEIKKIPVTGKLIIGEETKFTLSDGVVTVSVCVKTPLEEYGKKTDGEFAKAQLSKLGQSPFYMTDFSYECGAEAYFKASDLNALRREAVSKLKDAKSGKRAYLGDLDFALSPGKTKEKFYISASVETAEQAKALIAAGARVYIPYELEHIDGAYAALIPAVYSEKADLSGYDTVVAGSIGAAEYAKEQGKKVIADYSMNIFNSVSASCFGKSVLSVELSGREIAKISENCDCEAVVYGYIPVMTSANCIIKTAGKCRGECKNCNREIVLSDRKNMNFTVRSDGKKNTIYNSVPLFLADRMDEVRKTNVTGARLIFTSETPAECVNIYRMYSQLAPVKKPEAYTRGHFYNGV